MSFLHITGGSYFQFLPEISARHAGNLNHMPLFHSFTNKSNVEFVVNA